MQAAEGFCRKNGVQLGDMFVKTDGKILDLMSTQLLISSVYNTDLEMLVSSEQTSWLVTWVIQGRRSMFLQWWRNKASSQSRWGSNTQQQQPCIMSWLVSSSLFVLVWRELFCSKGFSQARGFIFPFYSCLLSRSGACWGAPHNSGQPFFPQDHALELSGNNKPLTLNPKAIISMRVSQVELQTCWDCDCAYCVSLNCVSKQHCVHMYWCGMIPRKSDCCHICVASGIQ